MSFSFQFLVGEFYEVGILLFGPCIVGIGMHIVYHAFQLTFVGKGAYVGNVEDVSISFLPDAEFDGFLLDAYAEAVAYLADGAVNVLGNSYHGVDMVGHYLLGTDLDAIDAGGEIAELFGYKYFLIFLSGKELFFVLIFLLNKVGRDFFKYY